MGVMAGRAGVHKLLVVQQFPLLPPASLRWELVVHESRGRSLGGGTGHLLPCQRPLLAQQPQRGRIFHPKIKVAKGSFELQSSWKLSENCLALHHWSSKTGTRLKLAVMWDPEAWEIIPWAKENREKSKCVVFLVWRDLIHSSRFGV